jgi:phosphoribosylglycinamide formyltransferase 2
MSETTEGETATDPTVTPVSDTPPDEVAADVTAEVEPTDARPVVLLLGAGERSRELTLAFQRLGIVVVTADADAAAPAQAIADRCAVLTLTDGDELAALIEREHPRYVVVEAEVVAADALTAAAERDDVDVLPTPRSIRLSLDREGLRRLASDELGLPTAPFWFAGSVEELLAVAEHVGFPLVVRPASGVPDNRESVLLRLEDVEPAWQRAAVDRVMVETVVDVDDEITLLTVRTTGPTGPAVHFCEPIGHRIGDGIDGGEALEAWQPQQMTAAALDAAKSVAARVVNSLGGRGVFAVELLVRGDEVYFSDVRPRPVDSGVVTVRSQRLSMFELHARAILGLSVDTIMVSPGAAEVSYGGAAAVDAAALADALAVPESDVRLSGRAGAEHVTVALTTAPDVTAARDRARRVSVALRPQP